MRGDLDLYFAMARGLQSGKPITAMEMTKWFDTNYHYLVPEFTASQEFRLARPLPLRVYEEAAALGHATRPVILGPVSFLKLGKTHASGVSPLGLLDRLLPAYEELLRQLESAGAEWVQLDEPVLVFDPDTAVRTALSKAFARMANAAPRLKILLAAYFGPLGENLDLVLRLPIHALHLDLVRAPEELDRAIGHAPRDLLLSLGLVDGRNIWKTDLAKALEIAERAADRLTADRVIVSPSCSLLHVPVDFDSETGVPSGIKDWLAFGRQKLEEVAILKRALNEGRAALRVELESNAESLAKRRASRHARTADIDLSSYTSRSAFAVRRVEQQKVLQLPLFPATTIGSFPQTAALRQQRARMRKGEIGAAEYDNYIRDEITHAIREQEKIGLDVLVHGEAERNDMVEYFGEQLDRLRVHGERLGAELRIALRQAAGHFRRRFPARRR